MTQESRRHRCGVSDRQSLHERQLQRLVPGNRQESRNAAGKSDTGRAIRIRSVRRGGSNGQVLPLGIALLYVMKMVMVETVRAALMCGLRAFDGHDWPGVLPREMQLHPQAADISQQHQ